MAPCFPCASVVSLSGVAVVVRRSELEARGDGAVVGGRSAPEILIAWIVGALLERTLVYQLPGPVIEYQEIDGLRESGGAFGLAIERQTPKIQPRRIAVVELRRVLARSTAQRAQIRRAPDLALPA